VFAQGGALELRPDIELIAVPDASMACLRGEPQLLREVQEAILEHCSRANDRFAILDAPPGSSSMAAPGSMNGALYSPWLRVRAGFEGHRGQTHPGRFLTVPPCGHVAGIYARSERLHGIHKAPANELVFGAVDLEMHYSDAQQAALLGTGVNCIRSLPGRGIRVWGARTLDLRDLQWRYVNVRRVVLRFVRWAEQVFLDLTFEPNDADLHKRIRERVAEFCDRMLRQGALRGQSAREAYFIKCDAELNPAEEIEQGRVRCDVGLAALAPNEFVIVRISRINAGVHAAVSGDAQF
jgi:phage tail sheath protein FI